MQLSPNFSLAELTVSEAARERRLSNAPNGTHLVNLRRTAAQMERVRALFDRPVTVTSAYRNPVVNRAVGGVPTSHHALGWAVDFTIPGLTLMAVGRAIAASDIEFDQLIGEWGRGILHISFAPALRRQVLTQRGGPGTAVELGLVP
ncbi:D-Ala-D-Ala carboxypeptidase family metallohydrolase [Sandarakinorhabdus sp.]|uniref:D-Ala-D-Ala carboxypeptidase family metallohydrolase n=1 Tax=Sandarakinorhabdus sp. TaxID=1916663 RepID=UPI00286EA9DE|nr:D-Ala-D-Ala carboxypeptidase family metallohydrolase [Sandarakinorhabdus sp.]